MTLPVPTDYEFPTHRGVRYLPNFWGDHYTRLPEIYHRFALSTDAGVLQLNEIVPLTGLRVLDLGSGTGRSAFAMAELGATVLGVDPSPSMREFAAGQGRGRAGVEFIDGSTSRLPEDRGQFDLVTSFHAPFAPEGRDVASSEEVPELVAAIAALLNRGGRIAVATSIPGWTHPWMGSGLVSVDGFRQEKYRSMGDLMREAGFAAHDEVLTIDYGSLDEALEAYGFVYGPPAIDWLLERQRSEVFFGSRVYLTTAG